MSYLQETGELLATREVVNVVPRFGDIEIKSQYSPFDEYVLSERLTRIAAKFGLNETILDYADSSSEPHVNEALAENVFLKVGAISSFSREELGQIIFEQARIYTDHQTMGDKFPRGNIESEEELLAAFLQGSKDTVVISMQHREGNLSKMVGGIMVVLNSSRNSVLNESGLTSPESQIPTFNSVQLVTSSEEAKGLLTPMQESMIACPSRFWRQDRGALTSLGVRDKAIAQKIVACIPFATKFFCEEQGREMPVISVFDTHDPNVVTLTRDMFGAKTLALNGDIAPTPQILAGILKHHYGGAESGGYFGRISLHYFETDELLLKGEEVLRKYGITSFDEPKDEFENYGELVASLAGSGVPALYNSVAELGIKSENQTEKVPLIEVLDIRNIKDEARFREIRKSVENCGTLTTRPFNASKEELEEFISKHRELPSSPEALLDITIQRLSQFNHGVPENDLKEAYSPVINQFSRMLSSARSLIESVDADSRWIHVPEENTLAKYTGIDVHRLHSRSRLLGLVPDEALDKLPHLRLGSIGASVAAGTLDAFVSLGLEHVTAYDQGLSSPSNQGRLPGGHFLDNGRAKAHTLIELLRGRNPYAEINGVCGKVVPDESSKTSPLDITFKEFALSNDLFLEIADAPHIKAGFREFMANNFPQKPVFFVADVGNDPFSNLEIPENGNFFGQGITLTELSALARPPQSAAEAMDKVHKMVKGDFPVDHVAQFTLARLGINAFWAQTPIAMRKSAAISADLLILYLNGLPVTNQNVHSEDTPKTLYPYTDQQIKVIKRVEESIFLQSQL